MRIVLVVDDEPAVCRSLVTLLRGAGHAAYAVYAGDDALELLRTVRVDVVVLDLVGVDGRRVLAAIRADPRTAAQKVLVYSAAAADGADVPAADVVLSKSASPARLLAEVAALAIGGAG